MVEWRPIIIGIIFIIVTYLILSLAENGGVNAVISFLLGGLIVGFIIASKISYTEKIKYSLIHGAILGVIASVISIVILLIQIAIVGLIYEIYPQSFQNLYFISILLQGIFYPSNI